MKKHSIFSLKTILLAVLFLAVLGLGYTLSRDISLPKEKVEQTITLPLKN